MATKVVNIVAEPATDCHAGLPPNKLQSVMLYKTAMAVFKTWQADEIITGVELKRLELLLYKKYGFSIRSIFRDVEKRSYT
jgi:hypothetical protein